MLANLRSVESCLQALLGAAPAEGIRQLAHRQHIQPRRISPRASQLGCLTWVTLDEFFWVVTSVVCDHLNSHLRARGHHQGRLGVLKEVTCFSDICAV